MPKYAPGLRYNFINVHGSSGRQAAIFVETERGSSRTLNLQCFRVCVRARPLLMNLPRKWMMLERTTAVFTLRTSDEERLKLRRVSKYTTKALGTYITSLGGVASA